MGVIRRIFWSFRARRPARAGGYGAEVLFAGWVELPAGFRGFREQAGRRGRNEPGGRRTLFA